MRNENTDSKGINIFSYTTKNLKRSINKGVITTIALSALLICGVINGLYLFKVWTENLAISIGTDYHVQVTTDTYDQCAFVANRIENEKVAVAYTIQLPAFTDENLSDFIKVKSIGHYLLESSYENKVPEAQPFGAQISDKIAERLGIKNQDGEEFTLYINLPTDEIIPVRFRISDKIDEGDEFNNRNFSGADIRYDDTIYSDCNFFMMFDKYYNTSENLQDTDGTSHPVIYSTPNFTWVFDEYDDTYEDLGDVYDPTSLSVRISRVLIIKFKDGYEAKPTMEKIAAEAGINSKNINYNYFYLSLRDNIGYMSVAVVFILALIVFSGAVVIYNIFNILIIKKINQIGLLTVIGASKGQIRSHIYCEALIYTVIGLPIGLILGTLTTVAVVPFLKSMDPNYTFALSAWSYIAAITVTIVTVAAGVIIPAFRASKITPIDAVRYSGAVPDGKKKRKKFLSEITIPALAKINLRRNKSRTKLTVLSLSISGVLFIIITSVLMTAYTSLSNMYNMDLYEIRAYENNFGYYLKNAVSEFTDENMEKLINTIGVKNVYRTARKTETVEMMYNTASIYAYDDELLQKQLDAMPECGITLHDLKNGSFLCFHRNVPENYRELYDNGKNINYSSDTNGEIEITNGKANVRITDAEGIFMRTDLDVAYLAPNYECVFGSENYSALFITSVETFEKLGFKYEYDTFLLKIDTEYHDNIKDVLKGIFHIVNDPDNPYESVMLSQDDEYYPVKIHSLYDGYQEAKSGLLGTLVISLTIVFILTLVGIMNLINIIVIGIEQRSKELGILSAIGMSKKDVSKLLRREVRNISLKSTIISVIAGTFGGYILILMFQSIGADYMTYRFPLWEILLIAFLYWVIPVLVTNTTINNLNKKSTVEIIRSE